MIRGGSRPGTGHSPVMNYQPQLICMENFLCERNKHPQLAARLLAAEAFAKASERLICMLRCRGRGQLRPRRGYGRWRDERWEVARAGSPGSWCPCAPDLSEGQSHVGAGWCRRKRREGGRSLQLQPVCMALHASWESLSSRVQAPMHASPASPVLPIASTTPGALPASLLPAKEDTEAWRPALT